jgi:hypothetical protein
VTRQREIPSILYRQPNLLNMTFPVLPGVSKIKVVGAARLDDAYGAVAGVAGNGALDMFEVMSGATYTSPSVRARKVSIEDINRGVTRMVIDPDDFATPWKPFGGAGKGTYLPTDDQTLFLRIQTWNPVSGAYNPAGPIIVIPPYDFFSTKAPVFTLVGTTPNLNIGAYPSMPDFLPPTVLNFMLPAYHDTVSFENLAADGGIPAYVSFHPGVPVTVIKANRECLLTGAGAPEFFVGSPNGNVLFTVRISCVNSA